jgi:hypothetical protein
MKMSQQYPTCFVQCLHNIQSNIYCLDNLFAAFTRQHNQRLDKYN